MPKPVDKGPERRDAPGAIAADRASTALQTLFGHNFSAARMKAGLTQRDIEMHTGIKQAYISQIEGGKQNPTLATMTALSLAVGKDVRALLRPLASQAKRK